MPGKMLPYEDFLKSFELSPRVSIELLFESNKKILLLFRDSDPYKDMWHLPGGYVLKDESFDEAIQRIAERELGLIISGWEHSSIWETIGEDPRGHIIHVVVTCKEQVDIQENENRKFFSAIPQAVIPYQVKILKHVLLEQDT